MNPIKSFHNNFIHKFNNNHLNKKVDKPSCKKESSPKVSVPSFAYQGLYCPNIAVPSCYKVDDKIYSNTQKFAKYYEKKLKEQMLVKTEKDIQNIIDNTVKITKANKKQFAK